MTSQSAMTSLIFALQEPAELIRDGDVLALSWPETTFAQVSSMELKTLQPFLLLAT